MAHPKSSSDRRTADFIEETSRLYADALGHSKAEISDFVKVYALISRMRVLSSSAVVEKAPRGRAPEGSGSRKRQLPCVMKAAAGGDYETRLLVFSDPLSARITAVMPVGRLVYQVWTAFRLFIVDRSQGDLYAEEKLP